MGKVEGGQQFGIIMEFGMGFRDKIGISVG
jgi:hypothetical protein